MDYELALKAAAAMAPVLVLLFVFDRLDVFNLINAYTIAGLLFTGAAIAAALALLANWPVMEGFPIGEGLHTRYLAPVYEELFKAAPIVALFRLNRIGFKLDAGIAGFAVGAGFSMVENAWYLFALVDANFSAWLVRGFGTAIMHGGATALFAVVGHEMTERQAEADATQYRFNPILFLPGLALAIVAHSAFNHFPNQPGAIMLATLLLTPVVLYFVFARNKSAVQAWLTSDQDAHRRTLDDIRAGRFAECDQGRALAKLADRFNHVAPDDVFAYIAAKTELILRAEELIHAAYDGVAPANLADDDQRKFDDLDMLERRLGNSVLGAIRPHLGFTRNDLWELDRLRARLRQKRS